MKPKFQQTFDKWIELNKQMFKDCEDYLKEVLASQPNKSVEFDFNSDEYVSVSYDGGNHPEYASNCFSLVERVFLKDDGEVYLDIEDDNDYSISNINADELYDVTAMVENVLTGNTEEE